MELRILPSEVVYSLTVMLVMY